MADVSFSSACSAVASSVLATLAKSAVSSTSRSSESAVNERPQVELLLLPPALLSASKSLKSPFSMRQYL